MSKAKPTKRIMRSFKMAEISQVDRPAQEGAVAVLIKCADEQVTTEKAATVQMPVAKDGYMFTPVMTTATEGHSHIIQIHDDCSSGYTDGAAITGATDQYGSQVYHSHPWLKTDAGIVIGESQGHTHLIEAVSDVAAVATTTTEEDMTTKAQEVTKSEADDAVVYTTADGCQIRKSHGDVALAQAKRNDALAKQVDDMAKEAAVAKAEIRKADLCKRAVALFKNLPGTEAQQGEMLGAIEAIPDEETRKAALAMVVAGNGAMAGAFKRSGTNDAVTGPGPEFAEKLQKFATEQKLTLEAATAPFMRTDEGSAAYAQIKAQH